jgi:hypothetical protein
MKYALIIGNNKYDDQKLAQLKTPAADSQALAKILDDKTIGSFDEVTPLINQTETRVRRAISTFLTNKKPDDLVLLYFSGHGILDDRGRLYLALKDTQVNLLKATSIPSSFVADEMDSCRSKRQILILDCCHSGAFARGTKGEQKAITETTFEGSGFGRVVLTASDSTQYALEGDQVIKQTELSLFTHFLLEGLKTGEADVNNDGLIALDEWYDYTYTRVVAETPRQVPHKWSYNQQGDLVIAKNPFLRKKVVELPYELTQALESSFFGIRESAVNELGNYLRSREPEMVQLAISYLEKMKVDDSRRISSLAERLLSEFEQTRLPSKSTPRKASVEIEPVTPDPTSRDALAPQKSEEIQAATEVQTSNPVIKKNNIPLERDYTATKLIFDRSFWFKWIGTAILGIVLSAVLQQYHNAADGSAGAVRVLFGVVAALTSLAQWYLFRNRLEFWWVAVNAASGIGLGVLHKTLVDSTGWNPEDLRVFLAIWLALNFVVGLILLRKPPDKSKVSSPIVEEGARQNIFLLLLSISLIVGAIVSVLIIFDIYEYRQFFYILYSISSVLVSLAFLWKKEIPRNLGFITLAIFLLIHGINGAQSAFQSDYSYNYIVLNGIIALVSGVFFISQRASWKNFGFLMGSGALIATGLSGLAIYDVAVHKVFLAAFILFAFPAATFFILRK